MTDRSLEYLDKIERYVAARRLLFQGAKAAGRPFDELWKEKDEAFAALVAVTETEPFSGTRGPTLEDAGIYTRIREACDAAEEAYKLAMRKQED